MRHRKPIKNPINIMSQLVDGEGGGTGEPVRSFMIRPVFTNGESRSRHFIPALIPNMTGSHFYRNPLNVKVKLLLDRDGQIDTVPMCQW